MKLFVFISLFGMFFSLSARSDSDDIYLSGESAKLANELIQDVSPTQREASSSKSELVSDEELYSFYQKTFSDGLDDWISNESDLWTHQLFPSLEMRLKGYHLMLSLPDYLYSQVLSSTTIKELRGEKKRRNFLSHASSRFKAAQFIKNRNNDLPTKAKYVVSDENSKITKSHTLKWIACLKFSPFYANKCSEALESMIQFMEPKGAGYLTAMPILKKIIEDKSYAEGASRAALKIMDKIKNRESLSIHGMGDLFEDIYSSYLSTGVSKIIAESMTWDLLCALSARGANTVSLFRYAFNKPSSRTLIALETIGMGTAVLDAITHQDGHLYSLPKQISTHALYGKPYHFWMSAYLARRALLESGSPEASMAATSIAELGYQMFSQTAGREKLFEQILTESVKSSSAHKVRVDLAFGFAGAAFGAYYNQRPSSTWVDLDLIFKRVLKSLKNKKSNPYPDEKNWAESTFSKYQAYLKWANVISFNSIYQMIRKQMVCSDLLSD